jgi:hypothetical protein
VITDLVLQEQPIECIQINGIQGRVTLLFHAARKGNFTLYERLYLNRSRAVKHYSLDGVQRLLEIFRNSLKNIKLRRITDEGTGMPDFPSFSGLELLNLSASALIPGFYSQPISGLVDFPGWVAGNPLTELP